MRSDFQTHPSLHKAVMHLTTFTTVQLDTAFLVRLHATQQFLCRNFQGSGKAHYICKRRQNITCFDMPQTRSTYSRQLGKLILRNATLHTRITQASNDQSRNFLRSPARHTFIKNPLTISIWMTKYGHD